MVGYPYSYGDVKDESNISRHEIIYIVIVLSTLFPSLFFANPCYAVDVPTALETAAKSRLALETSRSALCATAGACILAAKQQAKCGQMGTATAFACGAAVLYCAQATLIITNKAQ